LKPFQNRIFGWAGWKMFWAAGWLIALPLGIWAAPRIYHRVVMALPGSQAQAQSFRERLADKKAEFSAPWQDARPLVVFTGDSQIEFGDWYDLFQGTWAVRNCGLASARIANVAELVTAIGDPRPKVVVVMCGENNLAHESQDTCLQDYENLIKTIRGHLQPQAILVLSLMPLRASAVDRGAQQFNSNTAQFNAELARYCQQAQVEFLDVDPAVTDANGGLADDLTVDGLHPNAKGYRRLAEKIGPRLALLMTKP
jgi:lysophospholipase L1-like esterase